MALIRLDSARPAHPSTARRVEIGVAGLVALGEAAGAAGLPGPPPDLLRGEGDPAFALVEVAPAVDQARAELTRRGVIADGVPTAPVAADLRALAGSARRLRLSLAGGPHDALGYWWTDGRVAGSVVRVGSRCALSAFEADLLGEELIGPLPDPERPVGPAMVVPLDAFPVLAALDDLPDEAEELVAAATGVAESTVQDVARWSAGVDAVLLVSTVPPAPDIPARALVWFLHRSGWWSARLSRAGGRRAILRPARRRDLAGWVAEMTLDEWR